MAGLRRTWDKEYYGSKAKERLERGDDDSEEVPTRVSQATASTSSKSREEFQSADEGAAGPMGSERAFLKSRETKIDLESKVGKVEIIKAGESNTQAGPGYWCEVCKCLLKDSISYLDHINGKKHQRALGFSMRVEKVGSDLVKNKLDALKKRKHEQESSSTVRLSAAAEYEAKMSAKVLEEELLRKKRKEEAASRKLEKDELEFESIDPEISELMGFGGFGSSKK